MGEVANPGQMGFRDRLLTDTASRHALGELAPCRDVPHSGRDGSPRAVVVCDVHQDAVVAEPREACANLLDLGVGRVRRQRDVEERPRPAARASSAIVSAAYGVKASPRTSSPWGDTHGRSSRAFNPAAAWDSIA